MAESIVETESLIVELAGSCVLVPVRHHSPGCAWHVRKLIEELRPDAVLVEGPLDGNDRLGELLDPETRPPVALYCYCRADDETPASACWYPFCDYSPEYVALCTGARLGCEVAFIDLPSWHLLSLRPPTGPVNVYGDHQLRYHGFIDELCRKTRTRNFDELWDELFESDAAARPPQQFWNAVGAYCQIARQYSSPEALEQDGSLERERFMAAEIARRIAKGKRTLAVVGGFHRSGLLQRLSEAPTRPRKAAPSQHGCYLTSYGFTQLDRWSGYEAGMPAPAFYQALWESAGSTENPDDALLGHMVRALRQWSENLSTADVIAARALLEGLRTFRQHRRATREDFRDAVRSAWVKQAADGASRVMTLVDRYLTGDRLGRLAPAAGLPPLVRDFHAQVRRHRLECTSAGGTRASAGGTRQVALDIYTRPAHKARSALLHRLVELETGYALLLKGPRFTEDQDLDRVREVWELRWHPQVEARLIESAVLGATVEEAAYAHLLQRCRASHGRMSAGAAVNHLIGALVMRFDRLADELVQRAADAIANEQDFAQATEALGGLVHLFGYRAVLQAQRHAVLADLIRAAFVRSVLLLETLPGLSASSTDRQDERALGGLALLRHAAMVAPVEGLDGAWFAESLAAIEPGLARLPLLAGAAVGVLRQLGHYDDDRLLRAIAACLAGTLHGSETALGDFLRGLFTMARHALVESTGLLEAVHRAIAQVPGPRFLEVLPALRLAFTLLSPREVRKIATTVERLLGGAAPPAPGGAGVRPPALAAIDERVAEWLRRWGLV